MKIIVNLTIFCPNYILILLLLINQHACVRTYCKGGPRCLEWVCMVELPKKERM